LVRFDAETGESKQYSADSKPKNNSIYQIEGDPQTGSLFLASFRGGFQKFNLNKEEFTVFRHKTEDTNSISSNNLMSIVRINEDTLVIGTYGGGLNLLDTRTMKFTSITEADGLVNNVVYGLVYEGDGELWLSTNNGLVRHNIYSRSFQNFRPKHYLQSTEYNEGAFLRSSSGTLYFGGVSGLNYFKPDEVQFDTTGCPIYYTDFRGKFTSQKTNRLELSFLDSRLEIDFMSLYYTNPDGIKYSYRLKGYDNDWVVTNQNTAVYPRLSPGTYSFHVKAEDEFGYWARESSELRVVVNPPIWQRWWFIALLLLVLASLVYAIFRYRTKQIKETYKLQLIDSELAGLRSQMNPHFIFNSLNSIQYFILKKEPQEAYTYLSKFASLMRKILQNSRLRFISIQDEMDWLNLYLEMEKMRMDDNLDYSIKTRNINDTNLTNIPTMLIQPFVENSIVHGLLPKQDNRKLDVLIPEK